MLNAALVGTDRNCVTLDSCADFECSVCEASSSLASEGGKTAGACANVGLN